MKVRSRFSSTPTKRSKPRSENTAARQWTCRQIVSELRRLGEARNVKGIAHFERLQRLDARAARWIAADALRELRSDVVQPRLKQKAVKA